MDVREMSEGESEDGRRIRNLKKQEKEISRLKKVKAEEKIDFVEEKISKSESLSKLFCAKNVKKKQVQDCCVLWRLQSIVSPDMLEGGDQYMFQNGNSTAQETEVVVGAGGGGLLIGQFEQWAEYGMVDNSRHTEDVVM